MARDPADPKGLIREAYRMDGVGAAECRSIFLDWVLSLPEGQEPAAAIAAMLERHGAAAPGHPMTGVLAEGLSTPEATGRRGGRAARRRD